MLTLLLSVLRAESALEAVPSRSSLAAENVALRQQLAVLGRWSAACTTATSVGRPELVPVAVDVGGRLMAKVRRMSAAGVVSTSVW